MVRESSACPPAKVLVVIAGAMPPLATNEGFQHTSSCHSVISVVSVVLYTATRACCNKIESITDKHCVLCNVNTVAGVLRFVAGVF